MKRFLIAIFLVSLIPVNATSQLPNPDIQWTADWEIDKDVMIMELDENTYRFELILEFWINNNRFTPIEVGFDTEFEEVDFEVDDPGQVSVEGNTNKTFELKIRGSGLDSDDILYNADEFAETITLSLIELVAGQAADASRQISQDLEFSHIYDMQVEYEAAGMTSKNAFLPMKSGTTQSMGVAVFNYGNSDDAVSKYEVSISKCPQLTYEFDGASLPMAVSPATASIEGVIFGTIEVSAPSSHPTKECEVKFYVTSEGSERSSYATLTIDVESTEKNDDNSDDTNQDSDDSDSSGIEAESSSLPAASAGISTLTIILSALIRRED